MNPYSAAGIAPVLNQYTLLGFLCKKLGVMEKDIFSTSRRKDIVLARHLFCYILRAEKHTGYKWFVSFFNYSDHTTPMNSVKKISALVDSNDENILYILHAARKYFDIKIDKPKGRNQKPKKIAPQYYPAPKYVAILNKFNNQQK